MDNKAAQPKLLYPPLALLTLLGGLVIASFLLVQTYGYILLIPAVFSTIGAVLALVFFDWQVRHLVTTFSIQFGLSLKIILAYFLRSFGQLTIKEIALGILDVPLCMVGLFWLIKRRAVGALIYLSLFQTFGLVADCRSVTSYQFASYEQVAILVEMMFRTLAILSLVIGFRAMKKSGSKINWL